MAKVPVKLKWGIHDNLPTTKDPGSILFETDTGDVYVDASSVERFKLTDTGKADKAETLAGYGITDAYTKDEIDSLYGTIASYLRQQVDVTEETMKENHPTESVTTT